MISKKSPKADLEKKRPFFFLLGLALALVGAIIIIQIKTTPHTPPGGDKPTVYDDGPDIPITYVTPKEPTLTHKPKKTDPLQMPVIDETDPVLDVKDIFIDEPWDEPIKTIGMEPDPETPEPVPWVFLEKIAHPAECAGLEGEKQKACLNKWVNNYIGSKVRYPGDALDLNISGKVFVSFVVSETGVIENVEVAKGEYEILNREAERVIREMPAFVPASQFGKPVPMSMTVPVSFKRQSW